MAIYKPISRSFSLMLSGLSESACSLLKEQTPIKPSIRTKTQSALVMKPTKNPNTFKMVDFHSNRLAYSVSAEHSGKFFTVESFGTISLYTSSARPTLLWTIDHLGGSNFLLLDHFTGFKSVLQHKQYLMKDKMKFVAQNGDSFAWQPRGNAGDFKCIQYPSKKKVATLKRFNGTAFSKCLFEIVDPGVAQHESLISATLFIVLWKQCIDNNHLF